MDKRKRIAFFGVKTFPSRGGTDRVAENLILQLKDQFEITVYCFKDPAAQNHIAGVHVKQYTQWIPGAAGSFLYFFLSALDLFFFSKVDLVHLHKTESTFFAPLFRLRYKVVSTSHEAQYRSDKWNWFAKQFFHLVERVYIHSSDVCTCISNPLSEYYESKYKRPVKFIPNGINKIEKTEFNVNGAKSFLPQGANWDSPFVLFAARRLMSIKGVHTMLEALHKINYGGQVFITGELHTSDSYMDQLKKQSDGLNVFFLGFVNPLPTLLALIDQAELFIFPSETEGMSIMLLEVASVGTPVVASDIPENKQVFNEEEVLFFKSKDSDDLAEKLEFALANPEEMNKIGLNCQGRVFSDYLWKNIANSYAKVYEDVLG
jgi:glycosyltransferase involved in cell wall biosynthesis